MKRFLIFWSIMVCLSVVLSAQSVSKVIQRNAVKALIQSNGILFNDGQQGQFIPIQPGLAEKTLLKGSGLWFAGIDPSGNLRGIVTANDQTDCIPGLLTEDGGVYDPALNNVWQVTCADINQHLADLSDNGVLDNPNPNILRFPARGNPYFKEFNNGIDMPFTNQPVGGFFDRDDDGLYNPDNGDYPSIEVRGCSLNRYPDEQNWLVYNSFTAHPSGFGLIALEVQAQILAYKSNNSSPLNNALIVRYKIINRTDTDINSCYLGLFADFDIGNPGDDFMGSIPNKNIMYAYNGDLNDEGGFGQNIPVMAVDMLRGPLDTLGYEVQLRHIMALENADNLQASEYYNLLSGRFADGSPAPNNGVMYAGNPSDPNGNSEQALGNAPGQRVGLASYGPFTLQSSSVNELIVAYYYVYEPGKTPVEMVQQLFSNGNAIQGLYDNCFMDADPTCDAMVSTQSYLSDNSLRVYPNPTTTNVVVKSEGQSFSHLALSDLLGRQLKVINLEAPVKQYVLPTGGLATGVYLLTVENVTRKIVVQR